MGHGVGSRLAAVAAGLVVAAVVGPGSAMAGPPPGRGYELVSPVDKAGYSVDTGVDHGATTGTSGVADDGLRVAFQSFNPLPGSKSGMPATYLSIRGADGWKTREYSPRPTSVHPFVVLHNIVTTDFTPDLRASATMTEEDLAYADQNAPGSLLAPVPDLYVRRGDDGPYRFASTAGATNTETNAVGYRGMTPDASHVVFTTNGHLLPVDAGRSDGSGLYDRIGDKTIAIDVNTDGSLVSPCGASLGDSNVDVNGVFAAQTALSEDGRRVVFGAPAAFPGGFPPASPGCQDPIQLYLRQDNATTVRISRSRLTVPDATQRANFQVASADGSRIFFTTNERLLPEASIGGGNLYEYRPADDSLHFIAASVVSVVRASRDGSYLYFASSDSALGRERIYVLHDGAIHLVANAAAGIGPIVNNLTVAESTRDARVSPSGRYLAFATRLNPTSYDAQGTLQIYVYDAVTASLDCASCPAQAPLPEAGRRLTAFFSMTMSPGQLSNSRNVIDDGRVYFQSGEALAADDANDGLSDVYEYDHGRRTLISGGLSGHDAYLGGISNDGADVVFATDAGLVAQDTDNGDFDVYDARVGGGFAPPPAPVTPCSGDACQGAREAAPGASAVATGAVRGAQADPLPRPATKSVLRLSNATTRVRGSRVTVKVTVPAAGRVRVTGHGAQSVERRATKAGSVTIEVRLTAKARASLRRAHKLKLVLRVTWAPSTGRSSTTTTTATLKA